MYCRGRKAARRPREPVAREWDKYCQFYDLDYDRDSHDMPCDSWRFKTRPFGMAKIWYWYSEFQRGAMTRKEYHRLVLDFAARWRRKVRRPAAVSWSPGFGRRRRRVPCAQVRTRGCDKVARFMGARADRSWQS